MKKKKYIFRILIIASIFLFTICMTTSKAAFWSEIFKDGEDFLQAGKDQQLAASVDDRDTQEIVNDIYNILFPLGVATTVIVGIILGIKFMMASAEDKAKVKESMVPYVFGCIAIYGAFGIWRLVIAVLSSI